MKKNYLGALDIGSQHITFLLGEVSHQQLNLIGHAQIDSVGITKGQVEDSKALIDVLGNFFEDLSQRYSILPDSLCLTQSGSHLRNMQYETSLPLKGFQHIVDQRVGAVLADEHNVRGILVLTHSRPTERSCKVSEELNAGNKLDSELECVGVKLTDLLLRVSASHISEVRLPG